MHTDVFAKTEKQGHRHQSGADEVRGSADAEYDEVAGCEFDGATGLHRSALHLGTLLVVALIAAVSLLGRSLQRRGQAS